MSEHPDHPEHPAPDDFPADFFDDVAEPSPLDMNPTPADDWGTDPSPIGEPVVLAKEHPETTLPRAAEPDRVVQPYPEEVGHKASSYQAEEPSRGAPLFPIFMGILMLGSIAAAVVVNKNQQQEATPATPAVAASPTPATETPTPAPAAAPAPAVGATDAIAGEVKELKGQLDALSGQLKGVVAKVDGLAKPPEPVDLAPVQGKIDDLTKSVGTVAALSDKVSKLDERLGGIDGNIKTVNDKVAALSEEVKKAAEAPKPAPTATATEPVKPEVDQTAKSMTEGTDLFKAGKYKEAGEVFKKLEAADVKDARVYYYAALSNGLSTNDWKNETLKTAAKGAELEKAGVTKPAEIDTAFADLPATLKPWLTFFRKAAK